MRATNGRHKPSNGVPHTRIMAAFMLATLISTLFALPAIAAPLELDVTTTSSVPKVLPNGTFSYTVTVTNNSGVNADNVVFTDTVTGGGTMTAATPSAGTLCGPPALNATTCTTLLLVDTTSATVTFNVIAPVGIATVTDTVSAVSDTQGDLVSIASTLVANTTVENADLQVTKTHAPLSVNAGAAFTYTIAIRNNGPSIAAAVALADTAPVGVTFGTVTLVSSDLVAYTCPTATATSLPCALGPIASGTTVTLTVNATLASSATGAIANTATVSSTTLDAVAANNTFTDSLTPTSVDLSVTITVDPTTAAPGDTVTYTVTVSNPSATTDATNVVVTDVLPAGLTAVTPPPTPSAGTAAVAANTWTWTIPTIVKATSPTTPTVVTATLDAIVDPTTTLTTITNSVAVTATETDPVSTNNTASVDLAIVALVADLNVVTAVDDSKPNQGDTIKIYIQVSNAGPADATNIVLKDVLPTGLKYVSCEPTPCEQTGLRRQSSQLFSMPLVAANDAGTVALSVVVQASQGILQNNASVVSLDQSDPTGANNKDSLNITIAGTANNPGTGGTGSGSGGTSGSGGSTAFTGFTANQLLPWLMLFATLGLVALEYARRHPAFAAIGHTYGFDPWV